MAWFLCDRDLLHERVKEASLSSGILTYFKFDNHFQDKKHVLEKQKKMNKIVTQKIGYI